MTPARSRRLLLCAILMVSLCQGVERSIDDVLLEELHASAPGKLAFDALCRCPEEMRKYPQVCDAVETQCRNQLCMPMCLQRAWTPEIHVHCDRLPAWDGCEAFRKQVIAAAPAVTAQFQAHVCTELHMCNATHQLLDWVENHGFGDQYPAHRLPVPMCGRQQVAQPDVWHGGALCRACQRVVDVEIKAGGCDRLTVPVADHGTQQVGRSPLQARCDHVQRVIETLAGDLQGYLQRHVCSCNGCCPGQEEERETAQHTQGARSTGSNGDSALDFIQSLLDGVATGPATAPSSPKDRAHWSFSGKPGRFWCFYPYVDDDWLHHVAQRTSDALVDKYRSKMN